jgi:cell division protein FtsB
MTSPTAPVEGSKVKGSHKLLAGVAIFLGLLMVAVVLFSHRGLYQIYRFGHERLRLDQENARLAEENARLARTIDRLQHDPEMIQDLVRRELNFVKKNEIIFQLPPDGQKKPSAAPAPPSASQDEHLAKPVPAEADKKDWSWESLEGGPKSRAKNTQ